MAYSDEFKTEIIRQVESGRKIDELVKEYKGNPCRSTILRWKTQLSMSGQTEFHSDNGNDAIPSWSGYSYQGKVAILVVLCQINELLIKENESDISNWKIQLEKLQDFVLYKNGNCESLWQVKATLSKSTYEGYKEAITKLLCDRNSSNNKNAKCYLVSALNITDWGTKSTNKVSLYKYHQNVVDVVKIPDFIMNEIEKLLENMNIELDREIAYLFLCNLIDEKISEFHKSGKKNDYCISFKEFIERLKYATDLQQDVSLMRMKEELYKNIAKQIYEGKNLFCMDYCENNHNCSFCGVSKNMSLLHEVDISSYIRGIRPEVRLETSSVFNYNISDAGEYSDFICTIMKEAKHNMVDKCNNLIFLECFEEKIKVVPTLLDLSAGKETRVSRKLSEIARNEWLQSNLNDMFLVGETTNEVFRTKSSKFTTIDLRTLVDNKVVNNKEIGISYINQEMKQEKKKATNLKKDVVIIGKDKVLSYLEGESNARNNQFNKKIR